MKKAKFKMIGNGSRIEEVSESSCLCASVLKKDAGAVEGGFNTETQRCRGTEFKMTEIGLIPEDWEVKRLGEVCETSSGGTPSRSNLSYYDGNIKWFTTTELQDCNLYDSNEHISRDALKKSSAKIFPCGTLLMAMYGATIGRLGVLRTEAATNQACCAIFCGNLIDTVYTYYYLYHSRLAIIEKGCGAGQPNISQEIVRSLWISLPPLPEQKAIADALSDVDALIAAQEELIEKKRAIKQGAMQELLTGKKRLPGFGGKCRQESLETEDFNAEAQRRRGLECKMTEVGLIPVDWEVKRLGELFEIGHGRDYKGLRDGDVPVYGTGGLMTTVESYLYDGETVCIGRKGTIDNPMYHSGKIWTVDTLFYTHSFKGVIPKFLYYLFCLIDWMSYNEATGVPSLTSKNIEEIEVKLPHSLAEQKAIAEVLSDMDAEISELESQKAKFESIKQGMMQELLTGKTRLKGA